MKVAIALAALLAVTSLAPGVASAQSDPSITAISGNILKIGSDQGDLLLRWVETGLPVSQKYEVDYEISGIATAVYYCLAAKPSPCSGTASLSDPLRTFSLTTNNGTIRQTVGVDEPDPSVSTDTCIKDCDPKGLVLFSVLYEDITITDTNSGAHSELTGPLSLTFCKQTNLNNCPPPS